MKFLSIPQWIAFLWYPG